MDIKITLVDEDDYLLDEIYIYQDGSDAEGAQRIRDWIEKNFNVEDTLRDYIGEDND